MRKSFSALTLVAVLGGLASASTWAISTTLNGQPLRFDQPARL